MTEKEAQDEWDIARENSIGNEKTIGEMYQEKIDKLEKENRELKENSIPKSLVREKIEELDKEYCEILKDYGNIDTDVIFNIPNKNVKKHLDEIVNKIITYQELLGEED